MGFSAYLQSVIADYAKQRDRYVLTDLQVEYREEQKSSGRSPDGPDRQPEKKVERLEVLAGLRKYVQKGQVLLVGKPGSGKSTALGQLRGELAEAALADETQPIPVLVALRGLRHSFGILEAIVFELQRGDPDLDLESKDIQRFLLKGRLFLLLDGVNEVPSDNLYSDVELFRGNFSKAPMIFTSRELGTGLGIEQKLDMCGLTERQMRSFVQNYLPDYAEVLLGQLKDRLRELAETPLLLKLLCDVFDPVTQQIPQSKGELFRAVDAKYNTWKTGEGVRTAEKFWQWNGEILRYLAFVMLQADGTPTGKWLQIEHDDAEHLLEEFLQNWVTAPGEKAKDWLQDLLEHHLLQPAANPNEIEFHHPLFQEYYAAEYLLRQLPNLSEAKLKQDYLNLLKWTEPLAMMQSLVSEVKDAVKIVDLALKVDWILGARLAGEAKSAFQEQTVNKVSMLESPKWLNVELLGITNSQNVLPELLNIFQGDDLTLARKAILSMEAISDNNIVSELISRLDCLEKWVDQNLALPSHIGTAFSGDKVLDHQAAKLEAEIIRLLAKLSPDDADTKLRAYIESPSSYIDSFMQPEIIDTLTTCRKSLIEEKALEVLEGCNTLSSVNKIYQLAELLSKIRSVEAPVLLIEKLNIEETDQFLDMTINSLALFDTEDAIQALVKFISSPNERIQQKAEEILIKNRCRKAIKHLIPLLESENFSIRWYASIVLGEFGSGITFKSLTESLTHENHRIRARAAELMGNLESDQAVPVLISALNDSAYSVRRNAAVSLAKFDRDEAVEELLKALFHYYPTDQSLIDSEVIFNVDDNCSTIIRGFNKESLSLLGDDYAIRDWLADRNPYSKSQEPVVIALEKFNTSQVCDALVDSLQKGNQVAAIALANLGGKDVVQELVELLENSNLVSSSEKVVAALVKAIEKNEARDVSEMISLLENLELHDCNNGNQDYYFRNRLAIALMRVQHKSMPQYMSRLQKLLPTEVGKQALWIITAIQSNCQFYNYEIFCSDPVPEPTPPGQPTINHFHSSVGIVNTDGTVIHGSQTGIHFPDPQPRD